MYCITKTIIISVWLVKLNFILLQYKAWKCGTEKLTGHHAVLHCTIHRLPHGMDGLIAANDETIERLLNTCPEIIVQHMSGFKERLIP